MMKSVGIPLRQARSVSLGMLTELEATWSTAEGEGDGLRWSSSAVTRLALRADPPPLRQTDAKWLAFPQRRQVLPLAGHVMDLL